MARILITGAAGFIGYHLALALHRRGDQVLGIDNFNAYYDPGLKRARCDLLLKEGIDIIEQDICHAELLSKKFDAFEPTHCVHLAAQAGVRYSITHPHAYITSNIEGFLNILETCRSHPEVKLIYASSSSVYGRNHEIPFKTTDRTDAQASLYGVTKKTNELMASTYNYLYKIPVTGLRFFTVYGPWGRPDMAYFSFTKAILSGEPINIYNYGKQMRDFTYVDDIVSGTMAAIDLGAENQIFNLGNHKPVNLLDFISIIERLLGKEAIKNYLPKQAGDVEETYADIELSTQQLGFMPKTSIEEGLSRFVDWYQAHYSS